MSNDVKLGRDTGSVVNYMMSGQGPDIDINKGDGCTVLMWTDRYAATVVGIRGQKRRQVTIRRDKAEMVDGSWESEHQGYEFEPDPDGSEEVVSFRKGAWRTKGGSMVRFGVREEYRDPTF